MKKVITYGTFDLLHHGHINILKRAKELGDYLIVGVTGETYDKGRGKLNVQKSTLERVEDVRATGIADEIIIEEYEGQKIDDIQKLGVDIFAIGSDWRGKFDYLGEFCKVVYIERTKGVSSTQIRGEIQKIVNLGVIGSGRIAKRFIPESKYVSGVNVSGVLNPNIDEAKEFYEQFELGFYTNKFDDFIKTIDAVYIATPHKTHAEYIRKSLIQGKHVLCENPIVLNKSEAIELYKLAEENQLVLMEAIKTAYAPAFLQLIALIKSGTIGKVVDIEASLTKLMHNNSREFQASEMGGSITEMATYPLLPIVKLFGNKYRGIQFFSHYENNVDIFTKGLIHYQNAVASFKVGLGVKSEGDLIISGTNGYAYVPAPWWRTEYFELRFEDLNKTRKFFAKYEGEGLRYEINDFVSLINNRNKNYLKVSQQESITITGIIEQFLSGENVLKF